jgi:hypothetical protein
MSLDSNIQSVVPKADNDCRDVLPFWHVFFIKKKELN